VDLGAAITSVFPVPLGYDPNCDAKIQQLGVEGSQSTGTPSAAAEDALPVLPVVVFKLAYNRPFPLRLYLCQTKKNINEGVADY